MTNLKCTPIFNSEISIDVYDDITIKLPEKRVLDYKDKTLIIVKKSADKTPAEGLNIFISDSKNNNATGTTDERGKLSVPNNSSSTGDKNGTIGTEADTNKKTYVVSVTNKENIIINNCDIRIGESNDIVINLPKGLVLTAESPAIVTVLDQDSKPQQDVSIIVIGEKDYIEKGKTDIYGKLTVPNVYDGYTDKDGRVHVNGKNVFVKDERGNIENAYVKMEEDNSIIVKLPDGKEITHHNRTTVSVCDRMGVAITDVSVTVNDNKSNSKADVTDEKGQVTVPPLNEDYTDENGEAKVSGYIEETLVYYDEINNEIIVALSIDKLISFYNRLTVEVSKDKAPVEGMKVAVTDVSEGGETGVTDENGIVVFPPLNKDMTDSNGKAVVNGYNVLLEDETKPIENAFVAMDEGQIHVVLPETALLDVSNRITATITDSDNKPVKDMTVVFTDNTDRTEGNVTDENGKATVPPIDTDVTDLTGYSEVDGYIVTVKYVSAPIEKASVKHNAEVKNEDGSVKEAENISVVLPENAKFNYADRITVAVAKKADNKAVEGMTINISELEAEGVETKTLTDKTDKDGKAIFPALSEGKTDITDTTPGTETDEEVKTSYNVLVEDTKGKVENALVEVKDGKINIKLPGTHTLTTSNQITVTVTDKDNKAVANVSVTIADATTSKSGTTNLNGKVTLPVNSTGGGGSSSGGSSGGGGGGGYISSTVNVKVIDKDGKTVNVSKSTGNDKVTLTLHSDRDLKKDNNYYTVTIADRNGKVKPDYVVVLKDKNKNEVTGTTDKNGIIVLPVVSHLAYIVGYNDGTFRPDSNMTRAEATAIFARLISEQKNETISGKASFKDISSKDWFVKEVGYLEKYGIIKGYNDNTFKPDKSVTRAEFVAMTVRFNALFNKVEKENYTVKYTDLSSNYWAYENIAYAKNVGWLNGYADGTFKGDNAITRAEVVTVVNRATNRTADTEYITKNMSVLNKFTDIKDNSKWYFADVMEAANEHKANVLSSSETWVK